MFLPLEGEVGWGWNPQVGSGTPLPRGPPEYWRILETKYPLCLLSGGEYASLLNDHHFFDRRPIMKKVRGFTLIELLIVIAIILILIAIALPNFLEAQLRARVTKAKAELRSLNTALQSYYLDWDVYPDESEGAVSTTGEGLGLLKLTSPIKYIATIPEDPFGTFDTEFQSDSSFILYESGGMEVGALNAMGGAYHGCRDCLITFCMWSKGPDRAQLISGENPHYGGSTWNYSPTNGSKSKGSLYVWGGDPFFIGVRMDFLNKKYMHDERTQVGLLVDGQMYLHRFPPILP